MCVCHTYILAAAAALSLSVFRSRTLEDRKEEEEERILLASDVGKPCYRQRAADAADAAATAAVAIPRWRRRWL
jgi:hypothetical protein